MILRTEETLKLFINTESNEMYIDISRRNFMDFIIVDDSNLLIDIETQLFISSHEGLYELPKENIPAFKTLIQYPYTNSIGRDLVVIDKEGHHYHYGKFNSTDNTINLSSAPAASSVIKVDSASRSGVVFSSNSSSKLIIDSNGNIGIGTGSTGSTLHTSEDIKRSFCQGIMIPPVELHMDINITHYATVVRKVKTADMPVRGTLRKITMYSIDIVFVTDTNDIYLARNERVQELFTSKTQKRTLKKFNQIVDQYQSDAVEELLPVFM